MRVLNSYESIRREYADGKTIFILNLLNEKNSVTVTEIKELLGISESTIRRDLAALDKAGKLIKVFGGAVAADGGFTTAEPSVA